MYISLYHFIDICFSEEKKMYQHYYMNKMEEHHPVSAEKRWKENLCASLLPFFDYTDDLTDACILVGDEKIYCHRLILALNSNILEAGDVWVPETDQTVRNNINNIKLLPDFDDHPNTLRKIVRSLYCGEIKLNYGNIKEVYKFATYYQVKWLQNYAQSMFGEIIAVDNFVDLFKFAQKFGTRENKLVQYCLSQLDAQFLKSLSELETGNVSELDYYCLKSITSNNFGLLSPIEVFSLFTSWAEFELENRRCHIEILLFDIKYHRISKTDLLQHVYPWILSVRGLEDSIRTTLMRTITKRIRQADVRENFLNSGNAGMEVTEMRVDKYLGDIMQAMESKACDGDYSLSRTSSISSEELLCVVKARYPTAEPLVKQCIIEYINDNKMIKGDTVTHFMRLYEENRDQDIKYLVQKFLNKKFAPRYVQWETLSFNVVREFLGDVSLGEWEFLRVESIMQWAEGNSSKKDEIVELFTKLVCYNKIPKEYIKLVLKPFRKKILPEHSLELKCGVHEPDIINHHEETFLRCTVKRLSREFYLLHDTDSLCNKRHELAQNFLSLILINLVPKVASNCE